MGLGSFITSGYLGGIITLWRKGTCRVTPIVKSKHILHLVLSTPSLDTWIISVIYNSHLVKVQKKVWGELEQLTPLDVHWSIIGDFNVIVTGDEHKGGRFSYYNCKAYFFFDFITKNSLLDISIIGPTFS